MSASANVTLKIVSPNEFYSCLISVSTSSPLELVLDESKRKLSQHLQSGVPYTLSHRNNRSKSLQHLDMKSPIYKYNFTHGDKLILLPVTKSSDINVASPGLVSVVLSLATPSTTTTTTTTSKLDNGNNASAPKESLRLGPISFESGTSFGTIIYTFYTTHSDQFPNVTSQKSSIAIHPCLSYKYDGEVSESHLIGYDQISANFLNMKKGRLLLKLSFIPSKSSRIDDISRYKKFMEDFSNQSTREASFNTTDIETIRLDSHIVCTNNQLQPNAPVDEAKIDNCEINSIDNFVPSSECKNDIRTSQAKDLKIVESTSVLNQISAVETAIMDHKEGPDDSKAMLTNDSKMRNRNITIKRLLHESPPQSKFLDQHLIFKFTANLKIDQGDKNRLL